MQKSFKSMLLQKGGWFPISAEVVRETSPAAAILFFFLLDMDEKHADAEGWFYAKNSYLMQELGYGKDALKNAFALLNTKGYIGVKSISGAENRYKVLTNQMCKNVFGLEGAENPHTQQSKYNPAVLTHTPPADFPPTPCGLSAYPPAGNPHTNKELIYTEVINNNKKQKAKEIEEDANLKNSLPTPDFSDSIKQISFSAAKLVKPENLSAKVWDYFSALCISKKKKYTKSRWGVATNYLVEGFQKFGESAILEHLENWANSKTWTSPFFSNWHEAIQKANPQAAVSNDLRNLAENNVAVTKSLFMQIKGLYAQMGSGLVPCGTSEETEKEVLKELWVELLAVTPTQPAEFEKELILIEGLLKIEKAQRQNGKTTTQPKSFASWIKTKGWLLFVKAAKKAQQPAKTTPTAPQIEKPVQVAQKPTTAQISTNLGLMNVTPNYKVLGDAAEKAKAMQGKVFVWNDAELKYNNLELFRKFTGINRAILLEKRIFNITDFANYCVANFGVSVSDADKIARGMCHIIPETHEIIVTEAERAQFAPIDMSKYLTVLKSANA